VDAAEGVSLEVSALALGAIGAGAPHGRVHTAAAVHKVIGELVATEQEAAMLPPPDDGAPFGGDEVWADRPQPPEDPERRRKLQIAMGALGAAFAGTPGVGTLSEGAEITLGETTTSSVAPTELATTFVSPTVTAERPDGFAPSG